MTIRRLRWLGYGLVAVVLAGACAGADPTYVDAGGGGGGSGGGGSGGGGSGGGECLPESCPEGANATAVCVAGACALECTPPFQDCSGGEADGCEADTTSDPAHCGSCDSPCPLGCLDGSCNVVVDISVGLDNACAVLLDGSLWCWGRNTYGEHGEGTQQHDTPVQVALPGPASTVSVGGRVGSGHVCAAMQDGTVQCWGNGDANGNPSVNGPAAPPAAVAGLASVVQISAGGRHTCALQDDGDLFCWGGNFNGELGNGQVLNGFEDNAAIQVLSNILGVAAGSDHTCAVTTTGGVLCWGDNTSGQLGTGDGQDTATPVAVHSGSVEVAAGSRSSCARGGGEMFCWGWDLNGGVGEGTCALEVGVPILLSVADPLSIEVGSEAAAAIVGADAHVVAWGNGPHPDGSAATPPESCLPAAKAFDGVARYSLAGDVGCALLVSGTAMCWGNDQFGAVGDGPDNSPKPTAVEVAFPGPG